MQDEDEMLDQQREDAHRAIERGEPVPLKLSDDDKSFQKYAEDRSYNGDVEEDFSVNPAKLAENDTDDDIADAELVADKYDEEARLAKAQALRHQQERNIREWENDQP